MPINSRILFVYLTGKAKRIDVGIDLEIQVFKECMVHQDCFSLFPILCPLPIFFSILIFLFLHLLGKGCIYGYCEKSGFLDICCR